MKTIEEHLTDLIERKVPIRIDPNQHNIPFVLGIDEYQDGPWKYFDFDISDMERKEFNQYCECLVNDLLDRGVMVNAPDIICPYDYVFTHKGLRFAFRGSRDDAVLICLETGWTFEPSCL